MADPGAERKAGRLRGVTALPESHGERRFRARISRGGGQQVNLGVYPSRWEAAMAYNLAAEVLHGPRRAGNAIPPAEQPPAERVRSIAARVRRRLGLDDEGEPRSDRPPDADRLLTLFEVTLLGFWRGQVAGHVADLGRELDGAARRLVEAADLIFWCRSAGHPTTRDALAGLLARRLDGAFRRADLTRAVLDDEDDDELRMARWLVYPDELPGGGFRQAIAQLYPELLGLGSTDHGTDRPAWAAVLGLSAPFTAQSVREAYRARSKAAHPDTGGSHAEFLRLRAAYEEGQRYCRIRGY